MNDDTPRERTNRIRRILREADLVKQVDTVNSYDGGLGPVHTTIACWAGSVERIATTLEAAGFKCSRRRSAVSATVPRD